ncbi:branched-chain amino acid ABC transporter permease [Pararhodobacter sp. CCB-MM2]|uniref:branched-chain amino acid ABC transporter permease n=1 Tax=Pararhodobacter sp. CCB-MM2 TaxID=1786003 RepID=UPI00082CFB8F|nr:branched-chain amino acid ABC transporter permease [Pararhodobacter sp. CCB-MM2]
MSKTKLLALILAAAALLALPFTVSGAWMDIANQILLASIGALALMLLTGFAGQISLGHAGLLAAGAFTAGILSRELGAPFWVGIPAAGLTGALLGVIFGLPSLRLRGIYLAVSTLALHFLVVYLGGEYETRRGFSTGILIDPPMVFGIELWDPFAWYPVLLVGAILTYALSRNLLKSRTGRAWAAIHDTEPVAAALGINVARTKLWAFVITSAITAMAGALFAYYRGFVSIEAFSLFVTIQYVAMIIIGGMGSLTGAVLGAAFVTLLPHLIEGATRYLPTGGAISGSVFAMNYAAFGLIMIAFLVFEPGGLMGIARRLKGRG